MRVVPAFELQPNISRRSLRTKVLPQRLHFCQRRILRITQVIAFGEALSARGAVAALKREILRTALLLLLFDVIVIAVCIALIILLVVPTIVNGVKFKFKNNGI